MEFCQFCFKIKSGLKLLVVTVDYCNALYYGLPDSTLSCLQTVQNIFFVPMNPLT